MWPSERIITLAKQAQGDNHLEKKPLLERSGHMNNEQGLPMT